MAEIAASLVGPVIELGKCIAVPIKRQFHYLCCFDSNIKNLQEEAKKLDDAKTGLQMQVIEAENNGKIILPEVRNWLTSTDEIQVNVSRIETRIPDVQGGCSTMKSRFSLSREAEKMAVAIKQLRDCSKFDPLYVSQQPAAATESVPLRQTYEFDSRKEIEEEIMTTLRGKEINMIGLCGIGGVGKTTMAMRIRNRAREEHLFDEAVMVVVSQQVDLPKIQLEIAELLGLKFEDSTLSARAHALRLRLEDGAKRTLVVLDDVWNKLELFELGIPCASGCTCTVLLTSRNRDAFTKMECKKVVGIQILSESEAWLLFKEKAGAVVDDSNLLSVAEAVANECKGLPIALVTVGTALSDKKDENIWKDALRQLRNKSKPIDLSDFLEMVYKPLRLSYDFLVNPHAKSMFLLCCMFPEDYNIPLEDLTLYGWGLGIFEGIGSLEEARNNAFALADMLKSRSLLLDGKDDHHVKMHDVVRDTAIFIASKEGSLNLRLLLITNTSREKRLEIDDQFFEGKDGLNVLSISYRSLRLQAMQSLQQLRTLCLYSCVILDDISIVGELSNLEILSCRECQSIKEIPTEIGRLNRLRLLEFLNCWNVEKIAAGVISQLVRLEELKIVRSFDKWEISGLKELESLCNLTCMEIEIMNSTLAKENLNFRQKIVKYVITIGDRMNFITHSAKFRNSREKNMYIEFPGEIAPGNWIHNFLENSEALYLKGDGSKSLDLSQFQNLKWLLLDECPTMKKVVSTSSAFDDVFPFLEGLFLFGVDNLEEICDGSIKRGSNSFKNLRELSVYYTQLKHLWRSPNQSVSLCNLTSVDIFQCNSMLNVFSLAIATDCLPKLEELEITRCEMMEEVFCNEENENDGQIRHITFAKLERLVLSELPKLATFCRGIGSIEFPVLTQMDISNCPKLMSNPSSEDAHLHDVDSFHLFCNQEKVVFGNLKQLWIAHNEDVSNLWCRQIPNGFFNGLEELWIFSLAKISRSLFSASVAANLVNLKGLTITDCSKLVKVIEGEEEICANRSRILFPNLEVLKLNDLDKLEVFCEWRCDVELPSLRKVDIEKCIHMKCFSLGSVSTLNLETFTIDRSEIIDKGDLNGALLQHYVSGLITQNSVFFFITITLLLNLLVVIFF